MASIGWQDVDQVLPLLKGVRDEWHEDKERIDALLCLQNSVNFIHDAQTSWNDGSQSDGQNRFILRCIENDSGFKSVIEDVDNKKHIRFAKSKKKYYVEIRYEKKWYQHIGVTLKAHCNRHLFVKTSENSDKDLVEQIEKSIVHTHKVILCHLHLLFNHLRADFVDPHLLLPLPSFDTKFRLKLNSCNTKEQMIQFYDKNKRPYSGNKRQRYNSAWLSCTTNIKKDEAHSEAEPSMTEAKPESAGSPHHVGNATDVKKDENDEEKDLNVETKPKSPKITDRIGNDWDNILAGYIEQYIRDGLDPPEAREMAKMNNLLYGLY